MIDKNSKIIGEIKISKVSIPNNISELQLQQHHYNSKLLKQTSFVKQTKVEIKK